MEIESTINTVSPLAKNNTTVQKPEEREQNGASSASQEPTYSVTTAFSNLALDLLATSQTSESPTVESSEEAEELVRDFQNSADLNPTITLQVQGGRVIPDIVQNLLS